MSTSVLPQLQTVEAELASQESQLTAQLEEVRKKLSGIQSVISMFLETADAASVGITENSPSISEDAAIEPDDFEEETVIGEQTETEAPQTTKKVAQKKKTAKTKASAKKKDGRAASWQKYTCPGVKNQSMPDAVKLILETQPENEFKIADVMDALFEEKMPRAQYLKARNRISNVLSGGVRAGDWYKGDRGTYRMTAV
ncbi:MAG: hypothetical protein WA885_04785 [Phormidesmis sp.]